MAVIDYIWLRMAHCPCIAVQLPVMKCGHWSAPEAKPRPVIAHEQGLRGIQQSNNTSYLVAVALFLAGTSSSSHGRAGHSTLQIMAMVRQAYLYTIPQSGRI